MKESNKREEFHKLAKRKNHSQGCNEIAAKAPRTENALRKKKKKRE